MLKAVLWKELKDLGRDRKTLFAIVLLPLISLPLLGAVTLVLTREQPIGFAIVNNDDGMASEIFVNKLESWITAYSKAYGQAYTIERFDNATLALQSRDIDYVIIIPPGFSHNITSVNETAVIITSKRIDSARADMAETIVRSSISGLTREYARDRISILIKESGIHTQPDVILEPVRIQMETHKTGGAAAPPELQAKVYTVRILAFALFFVISPSVSYIVDSIMGEKERKTLEALLATPVKRRNLLGGKLAASSIIGILAGMADVVGVIIYFIILEKTYGGGIGLILDYKLVMVHSIDIALTVFATSALITPFIIRAGSVRTANITSSAIIGIALLIFFSVLFADIERLPKTILYPLYLVPYTHSVLILNNFVEGDISGMLTHIAVLLGLTIILYVVSFKTFNTEKLLMPPSMQKKEK